MEIYITTPSKTIHRGFISSESKEVFSHESCNLDDVDKEQNMTPDPVKTKELLDSGYVLCVRCFPGGLT